MIDRAAEARAVPLLSVFAALGVEPRGRATYGPCPACGAETRGTEDRRGPLGLSRSREGWRCHGCAAGGDGLSAVRLRFADWPSVWGWYADRGWCASPVDHVSRPALPPPPAPPPKPPSPPVSVAEVAALLRRCVPVPDVPDVRMRSQYARYLPDGAALPPWAVSKGGTWLETGHRVLVPLWDVRGHLAGIRARAADRAGARPKALPPWGHSIGPVCMATPAARAWLRGGPSPDGVVIVEGEPGYLLWAAACPASVAVLGIVSGSWSAEWSARVGELPAVVVLDHDQGETNYLRALSGLRRPVRWAHDKESPPVW